MRTTLTLDPDIAVALKKRAAELGLPWKAVVNSVLRDGLATTTQPPVPRPRFRTRVHDAGPPALPGVHSIYEMLVYGEGEAHR